MRLLFAVLLLLLSSSCNKEASNQVMDSESLPLSQGQDALIAASKRLAVLASSLTSECTSAAATKAKLVQAEMLQKQSELEGKREMYSETASGVEYIMNEDNRIKQIAIDKLQATKKFVETCKLASQSNTSLEDLLKTQTLNDKLQNVLSIDTKSLTHNYPV